MAIDVNKYKNIIFDLGGVLLNINHLLAVKAFSDLGFGNLDPAFSTSDQKKIFDLYEKGEITSADFRNGLKKYTKRTINDSSIDTAWNSMLLDLPKERLDLLQRVKQTHRSFLLSNTNEIHISAFKSYLQNNFKMDDLSGYFEKIYLSFEVKMRKPDAEIFELVLSENKLQPRETLFIDDTLQHIEGAKKLGIQTYWLDVKKESVLDLFQ